jgi:hypothetical protein
VFEAALFVAGIVSIWFALVPKAYSWPKPLSCEFCLIFWISLVYCIVTMNWNLPGVVILSGVILQVFRTLQDISYSIYDKEDVLPANPKGYTQ